MPHELCQVNVSAYKALSLKYIDRATENTSIHPVLLFVFKAPQA